MLMSARPVTVQQVTPQFRARLDLIQVDVSVIDKDHQPVRGLTADDFTVLESGTKQTIEAFVPIDLPEEPPRAPGWMRDVAPDVIANTGVDEDRLIVIVLDDYSEDVAHDSWAQRSVKQIGHGIVDRLGPRDLAAVVHTVASRSNQEFTHDHERLSAAIDRFNPSAVLPEFAALSVLERVCEVLGSVPQRRKVMVWVSSGATPPGSNIGSLISLAQRFNVNVYPIDPTGIRVGTTAQPSANNPLSATQAGSASDPIRVPTLADDVARTNNIDRLNNLRSNMFFLANMTGGHFFQLNEFTKSLNQVFRETGSFYLLGYVSSGTQLDDKYRPLEVRVNRKGATVHARTGTMPDLPPAKRQAPVALPAPTLEALAGLVPTRGVPLSITAVPFAVDASVKGAKAAVAITLGLPAPTEGTDDLDVLIKAFTFDGTLRETRTFKARVDSRAAAVGPNRQVQIVDRIELDPGRYQLRASATSAIRNASGSVYSDLDVPDFSVPLSMSGVALSDPGNTAVVSQAAEGRLPQTVSMTTRAFKGQAQGSVEIYQGAAARQLLPVAVAVSIRDDREAVVSKQVETIDPMKFEVSRRVNYRFDVPVTKLEPGEYLLTIDVKAGQASTKRDVRFSVTR